MRVNILAALAISVIFLAGCSKNASAPASATQATVTLSDGTTFSGAVTADSQQSITLQASTGESRTYPKTQVSSVQYAQPQPAQTAANQTAPPQPAGSAPPPADAASTPAAPPPPADVVLTIPAGTTLQVRNNDTIDSETAQPGQQYGAVVNRDVRDSSGDVAIPKGSGAMLVVRSASGQGKFQGQSDIVVDVASVTVNSHTYRLETSDFAEKGQQGVGKNKRTAEFAGGGAALGGIIGAIAGHGKGAAIGALAGGAAGTGAQAVTRGKAVRIPSETLLSFRLEAPVNIHELQ